MKEQLPEPEGGIQPLPQPSKKTISPDMQKILIAGSDGRFNKSLQELLLIHDYVSHIALTEQEVITCLNQYHFALIILELKIIEIHGRKMMEFIKSKQGKSKLIMLSNDSIFDKAVWALRQGANDFFKTPYSPDELLLSIQKQFSHTRSDHKSQRSQSQLLNSELLHRYMIHNSPDIIYLLDHNGNFSFFNKQVDDLLGFSRKELLGKHYSTLIHPEDLEKSRYVFSERRTGVRASKNIELRLLHKTYGSSNAATNNSEIEIELHTTGIYKNCKESQKQVFLGTYGVARDISQRKMTEKQYHHQLNHDELTNLPNRILFRDRLRLALVQAKRIRKSLAVMFLDIDDFKKINDSFGHAGGDSLLQTFSVRLKSCLRESDTLARISGDEFTILIPQINSYKDTKKIARKIINEFLLPFKIDQMEVTIGVSIGIALSPEDSKSEKELMLKADSAMYYVKHHGKNGFMHYDEILQKPGDHEQPDEQKQFN